MRDSRYHKEQVDGLLRLSRVPLNSELACEVEALKSVVLEDEGQISLGTASGERHQGTFEIPKSSNSELSPPNAPVDLTRGKQESICY